MRHRPRSFEDRGGRSPLIIKDLDLYPQPPTNTRSPTLNSEEPHFVAPRLIEAYAQAFARYVQCEQAISKFGLLGKHPTTGAAIASPFVATSQSFGKQTNVYWYEIYEIVRATCTTDYAGTTPGEEVMEQLLNAHY